MSIININHNAEQLFIEKMAENGLVPHKALTIEADGQLKRFRVQGDKSGTKNGWYVLFNDGLMAGSFGNWKTGFTCSWCSKSNDKISKAERYKLKLQRQKATKERELQRLQEQHDTAIKCGKLWNAASQLVKANHPYLLNKQIRAYGIRQLGKNLLIPVQDAQNRLVSLQFIMPDGSKTFKSGGKVKGCFCLIGELKDTIFICEGYATAATIHQATGKSVIVAFNAANLSHVITALKARGLDYLNIIIVADNDASNKVNTGLIKGQECARLHNIPLIYPIFTDTQTGSDFNDLASLVGLNQAGDYLRNAVKEAS